jgi:hypothetical protein
MFPVIRRLYEQYDIFCREYPDLPVVCLITWLMSTLGGNLYSKSEWPKEK